MSRRIFGGSLKFPFEFGVPVRIEFENEALAVPQRGFVRGGEWVITFAERMNRTHKVKWRFGIGHAPDAGLWKFVSGGNCDGG